MPATTHRLRAPAVRQHGAAVSDLEVRRRGLEDAYLALVRQVELPSAAAPVRLTAVGR
jgi:hypothetical protein